MIAAGREESLPAEGVEVSPLVAEGIAGAVVSILGTRLAATGRRAARGPRKDAVASAPLSDLLGELMGLIVLPYLGPQVAREERARPAPVEPAPGGLPVPAPGSKKGGRYLPRDPGQSRASSLRMTYRTALVLEAIAKSAWDLEPRCRAARAGQRPRPDLEAAVEVGASRAPPEHRPWADAGRAERMAPDARWPADPAKRPRAHPQGQAGRVITSFQPNQPPADLRSAAQPHNTNRGAYVPSVLQEET